MNWNIQGGEKVTAGTAAKTVKTAYQAFILENNSANDIYFGLGTATTDSMCVKAGTMFPFVLTAEELSVISTADSDLRILYVVRG